MEKEAVFISDAAAALGAQLAAMQPEEAVAAVNALLYPDDETAESTLPDPHYDTLDDYVGAALTTLPHEASLMFFDAYAASTDMRDQQDILHFLPILLAREGEPHELALGIWHNFLTDKSYDVSRSVFTHLQTAVEADVESPGRLFEITGLTVQEANALAMHYVAKHPESARPAIPQLAGIAVREARRGTYDEPDEFAH